MAKKQKFYVVWKGRRPGICSSWDECRVQVENFPGAEYKSFASLEEAERAFAGDYADYVTPREPPAPRQLSADDLRRIGRPIAESYAVDAACRNNPGILEYRCVHNTTGREIFRQGPYAGGTNNIGEFLAIVHALALFKRRGITAPIYSDSKIALKWVEARKCRTTLAPGEENAELFRLIEQAEKWLMENYYSNRVLKWHTEVWGEIPADFGRK